MAGEETIAALLAIWDEGQSSAHWPALLPVLRQLVDQFQQSADNNTRAEIAMRITDLLRETDPDLHRKLIQMRRTITLSSVILGFGNVSPLGYSTRWR